jgi:hypothetical protein
MFKVIVVVCLVILVMVAVPQIATVIITLFAAIMLLYAAWALLPIALVLLSPLAIYMLWYFATLDNRILEAIEMKGGTSTVGEVIYEVGSDGSETKDECSWAVCRTYDYFDELAEIGEIVIFSESGEPMTQTRTPKDQIKILSTKAR